MKMRSMRDDLLHADSRTDVMKLMSFFEIFANAPMEHSARSVFWISPYYTKVPKQNSNVREKLTVPQRVEKFPTYAYPEPSSCLAVIVYRDHIPTAHTQSFCTLMIRVYEEQLIRNSKRKYKSDNNGTLLLGESKHSIPQGRHHWPWFTSLHGSTNLSIPQFVKCFWIASVLHIHFCN